MNRKAQSCSICGDKHLARGLCQVHYNEARRRGEFAESRYTTGLPVKERLAKCSRRDAATGCLLWTGNLNTAGYGRMSIGNVPLLAHRVAYATCVGPVPDGMFVCHSCDRPACIEPSHLFLGTNADNMADKVAKGRQLQGEAVPVATLTADQVLAIRADPRRQWVIAQEYGVTQGQVSFIKRFEQWQSLPLSDSDQAARQVMLDREARGQRYPHCKLVPDDVRAIRRDTRTTKEIATSYGVDTALIGRIKQRKIWKHVVD
jgi:hypothetical protein